MGWQAHASAQVVFGRGDKGSLTLSCPVCDLATSATETLPASSLPSATAASSLPPPCSCAAT